MKNLCLVSNCAGLEHLKYNTLFDYKLNTRANTLTTFVQQLILLSQIFSHCTCQAGNNGCSIAVKSLCQCMQCRVSEEVKQNFSIKQAELGQICKYV